jgi:hypothetical protein
VETEYLPFSNYFKKIIEKDINPLFHFAMYSAFLLNDYSLIAFALDAFWFCL